jgi:hypothetical protein
VTLCEGLSNKELLLQPIRVDIVPDPLRWVSSARRGSLVYRLDSVPGELGGHRLAYLRVLPGEFRVR